MVGRDRQLAIAAVEAGPTLEEPELLSLRDNADGDQEFRDRSTGLPLNPEVVRKAREHEMQHVEELKVLEDSDRDAFMAGTGRPPIPTDWVDINKDDSLRPNDRSRLVCQETRGRSTIDVEDWAATFAATPPCEAFKLQLSLMMTGARSQVEGDDDVLIDDFSLSGRRSLCNAFREELGKHLLAKTTAVMGPSVEMGDVQEATT